ncbi:hypothetical protein [Streptomyces sp. NPDC053079]|uniref:hypothetical protein n=1 Tax=Streptomyces sp. NPDC053079 TaxID=3365697 RepID=UPI0037D02588
MWRLCESAHAVLTDEGGAILDEHTGRWTQLTPTVDGSSWAPRPRATPALPG